MRKEKGRNNEYGSDWIPYIEEVKRYKEFANNYKNKSIDPYINKVKKYKEYANRFNGIFNRDVTNRRTKERANERDKNS